MTNKLPPWVTVTVTLPQLADQAIVAVGDLERAAHRLSETMAQLGCQVRVLIEIDADPR